MWQGSLQWKFVGVQRAAVVALSRTCSKRCRAPQQPPPPPRLCFSTARTLDEEVVVAPLSTTTKVPPLPRTSQPLGHPMPTDEHACSVSLPTWSSVVGYEEGCPSVVNAMLCGYPRFVYHPYIRQLMAAVVCRHGDVTKEDCLVLPCAQAAERCLVFLQQAWQGISSAELTDNALIEHGGEVNDPTKTTTSTEHLSRVRRVEVVPGVCYGVIFPAETQPAVAAKAYWQHTGEIVSSRRARHALERLGETVTSTALTPGEDSACHQSHVICDDDVQLQLRQRIASWACVDSHEYVFLTPSGMSAIYLALRSARRRHFHLHGLDKRGGTAVVYGFPYLDTLKLCTRPELSPGGVQFFGKADDKDLATLRSYLQANPDSVSVLFTEVPSNPLLTCPDLRALRELANEYNFVLAVDDTISNFLNVDLIQTGLADVICTSLTKLVSGRGDAIAGSCVVNSNTAAGQWMQQDLKSGQADHPIANGLFCPDAKAVLRNSEDFVERNQQINETSEQMADWLVQHPDVERVYYPKHVESADFYSQLCRRENAAATSPNNNKGYGGLLSIVLCPHICQRSFYDALNVAKGPSLGTNFTLVCPYTLLAHYHELDFAMSYNVPPNLLRIAVGLESLQELQDKFSVAFSTSRLYPKPAGSSRIQR